jgi:hypothetical protein
MTKRTLALSIITLLLSSGLADAASKKNTREGMSAEQKTDLRKRAYAYCKKKYVGGGQGYVEHVMILSDGRVRCRIRG